MEPDAPDPSQPSPVSPDATPSLSRRAGSGSKPSNVWQPPTPEELQAQIPQYKILDLLGRGGMGAVYKGWQMSLDRYVAIKILPPDMDDGDAQFTARFKQEAKTMAKFMHPGIVGVFDAGETAGGLLYIVMEFVEGTDVSQLIRSQGRLTADYALAITAHVCDALQYAHTHGVIHRDIKPANIMLNMEGAVKVADFGLAKGTEHGHGGLTKTNMAMGTPDYVAPEALITGIMVDHRADLYAVGVMLYNLLTGDIPRGVFRPASKKVGSDPRFDAIISKAMEQEREERYQSALEIRRDLDVILTTPQVQAEEPQPPQASAPARGKPVARGPQPRNDGTPAVVPSEKKSDGRLRSREANAVAPKKSSTGMIAGIIGTAAVIGIGAFLAFKKPKPPNPDGGGASASVSNVVSAEAFAAEIAKLSPKEQVDRVIARIRQLNNGENVKFTQVTRNNHVDFLQLDRIGEVKDLSPVSALKELRDFSSCYMHVVDFSFLRGLSLERLAILASKVTDLSALKGMPLKMVRLIGVDVTDLSVLADAPVDDLWVAQTPVSDLSFARKMPLRILNIEKTKVRDLSPIKGKAIESLKCDAAVAADPANRETLRSLTALKKINDEPIGDFWKRMDGGGGAPLAAAPPSPPVKQTLDLLALTDPVMDRVNAPPFTGKNEWARSQGSITFISDGKSGKLAAPVAFACRHYEIELRVQLLAGSDRVHMDLPLGDGRILPLIFNLPNRKILNDKEGGAWKAVLPVVHVTARVNQSGDGLSDRVVIQRKDNGESLVDWTGSLKSISRPGELHPGFPGQPVASVFVISAPYSVKTWTLRVYEGEAKVLRGAGIVAEVKPAVSPPASGTINLLATVDTDRDKVDGSWVIKNGELNAAGGYARLAFNYQPPEEYDFSISFTRTSGTNAVAQHVSLGGRDVMWLMGGFGNSIWGFEQVGGKAGRDNATTVRAGLQNGRRYHSTVKVRRDSLQVVVDGKQVVDHKTSGSDLSTFQNWSFPDPKKLGVGCQQDTVFHSVEVIPHTGAATVSGATPAPIVTPPPAGDARLAQLEAGFKSRFEIDAQKPFEAALAALNQSYVANGIGRARSAAQSKGLLDEVNALDSEKARVQNNEPLPPNDPDALPASLKALRATYRAALAKLETARAGKAAPLYDIYLSALDAHVTDLTKANKLDEAQKVKALREGIAASRKTADAPPVASGPPAISLFDGQSLDGWRFQGSKNAFAVEDGMLKAAGPRGNLMFEGTKSQVPSFTDFDLTLKVKTMDYANSGVWIHCPRNDDGISFTNAIEVQIANENVDKQKTGSLWSVAPVSKLHVRDGEWFDLRIVVRGKQVTVSINGKVVNEWKEPANWQPPSNVPAARLGSGTIGLQSNVGVVCFKDILIRPL